MPQVNTAIDIQYIKKMLLVYGFTMEFIAKDMGVKLSSLERRIERAKKRGEW